ncbi:resolvase [Candidatus Poribacteria bacterium]|nr:resolvase [Candidatus Poribacteria bacterium]
MSKVIGYIRICSQKQEIENQQTSISRYADKNNLKIDDFVDIDLSIRKIQKERQITQLLNTLNSYDTLIVAELSRLGRSLNQIIDLIKKLMRKGVRLITVKEGIDTGQDNTVTKTQMAMFNLFAEIERDLLSQRTREGLARARKEGKILGRPKGSKGTSILDGKEDQIKEYLKKGINKTAIAKLMDVSRPTVVNFIKSRDIDKGVR